MRVAICDDDPTFISILSKKLERISTASNITIEIYSYTNPQQLVDIVASSAHPYDIYFLDIEMPNKRGTTLAREIRLYDPACKIAFITSYDDEIYNAFRYKVDAFIPKQLIEERLSAEVLRFAGDIEREHVVEAVTFDVELPQDSRHSDLDLLLRLQLVKILYFESSNRQVLLHTMDATYTLKRGSYQNIRAEYLKRGFAEVHRCYLVNVTHLKAVGKSDVLLDNDESLPLSRRQHNSVVIQYMTNMRR